MDWSRAGFEPGFMVNLNYLDRSATMAGYILKLHSPKLGNYYHTLVAN